MFAFHCSQTLSLSLVANSTHCSTFITSITVTYAQPVTGEICLQEASLWKLCTQKHRSVREVRNRKIKYTLWHSFFVHINTGNCLTEKLKVLEKESGHADHLQEVARWLPDSLKCCDKAERFYDYIKSWTIPWCLFNETKNTVIKTHLEGQ